MLKLVDSNVWIALTVSAHQAHNAAREWMATQTTKRSILFSRATQQSALRLLTTDAVMKLYGLPALANRDAWDWYERLLEDDRIGFISEPNQLASNWKRLARIDTASPKLWMDSYLAAFAIAAGCQLVTTDAGFQKFKGLSVHLLAD